MMAFTATTFALLVSAAHIAFAQTSLEEELFQNACQVKTNKTVYIDFLNYVIARHSIYEDDLEGQRRMMFLTCFVYILR